MLVERAGLHLYPWEDYPYLGSHQILWVPYGNLWFIYAILVLTLFAAALSLLPRPVQVAVALLGMAGMAWLAATARVPVGLEELLKGLAYKGMLPFMLGVWMGPGMDRRLPRSAAARIGVGSAGAAVSIMANHFLLAEGVARTLLVYVPLSLSFLICIRIRALSDWPAFLAVASPLGRRSLEVFLLHEFMIAGLVALLGPRLLVAGGAMGALALWLAAVGLSLLTARLLRRIGGDVLFERPFGWLVRPRGVRAARGAVAPEQRT